MASGLGSGPNYAFPDTGAVYWTAKFTMPAGSRIVFKGRYAHAGYESLNSYDGTTNAPIDAINDISTSPNRGSSNPFLPGANRAATKRSYAITVLDQPVPTSLARNTLYAGAEKSLEQASADGWTVVSIKNDWATVFPDS